MIVASNYIDYKKSTDIWLIKTDSSGEMEWNKTIGGEEHDVGRSIKYTSDGGYIITGSTQSFTIGETDIWLIKINNNGIEEWNRTFGGVDYDVGYSVIESSEGGYILTGYTKSFGSGGNDLWLIKTDNDGNMLWNKTYGGIEDDIGESIVQTTDEGYIITGNTCSYGSGWTDVWLLKTDKDGNEQWNKTYGEENIDMGLSIQQTNDEGFIICGIQCKELFGPSDIWLIKTNNDGNIIWDNLFPGYYDDVGFSVLQTNDNGYLIAGYTNSYGEGWVDIYLVKTDSEGQIEWYKTLGGEEADVSYSIQETKDGGYIIIGFTNSFEKDSFDVWLIKILSFENKPPEKPDRPIGPSNGRIGFIYNFSCCTTDPDYDQLCYMWDWSDGTTRSWIGPYCNDKICNISHIWNKTGNFNIRVKAKDIHNQESEWSDPLVVIMSRVKFINHISKMLIWLFERFPFLQPYFSN